MTRRLHLVVLHFGFVKYNNAAAWVMFHFPNPATNASIAPSEGFSSGRLWNLWDMLKNWTARDFYVLSQLFESWQNTIKGIEQNEGIAKDVRGLIDDLRKKDATLSELQKEHIKSLGGPSIADALAQQQEIDAIANRISESFESIVEYCDILVEVCEGIDADLSIAACKRLAVRLKNGPLSAREISKAFEDIDSRIRDELENIPILLLNAHERKLYNPRKPLFGNEFETKFATDGAFELDEAAKCLALGRPTAAVFHLMRILELGIRALARSLQIPDPLNPAERNWGKILGYVLDGIEAKWRTNTERSSGDGALFEELHASLDAVKNPWRNPTMHVGKKYTDDEANHILQAVGGFMRRLASRMDENGEPLA